MCVYVCVCERVCACLRACVFMCLFVCACTCVCLYVCMLLCVLMHIYVNEFSFVLIVAVSFHLCTHRFVCTNVYLSIHEGVSFYIYANMIYWYIHMYMHACACVSLYVLARMKRPRNLTSTQAYTYLRRRARAKHKPRVPPLSAPVDKAPTAPCAGHHKDLTWATNHSSIFACKSRGQNLRNNLVSFTTNCRLIVQYSDPKESQRKFQKGGKLLTFPAGSSKLKTLLFPPCRRGIFPAGWPCFLNWNNICQRNNLRTAVGPPSPRPPAPGDQTRGAIPSAAPPSFCSSTLAHFLCAAMLGQCCCASGNWAKTSSIAWEIVKHGTIFHH